MNSSKKPLLVRCLNPFRWIDINYGGRITPCCLPWFKGDLGSIENQTLEEIWNSFAFQELREAMYKGGDWKKFCNPETCPQIQNDIWNNIDEITPETHDIVPITESMLNDIRQKKTVMSEGPLQIGIACDPRCNLQCIMCSARTNPNRDGVMLRKSLEEIKPFLPTLKRIRLMGDGEVFAIPEMREFLFHFDSGKYPETAFAFITNGILLTPEFYQKISHLKIDCVIVSIDASTKETYEKIRIGGKWEVLMRNLEFLVNKYREGIIHELHICMCVMKSNHKEIIQFAEMGKRLGVTSTYYLPILGDYGEEQIFEKKDIRCLKRVSKELNHPIMKEHCIDTQAVNIWRDWNPFFKDYLAYIYNEIKHFLIEM